MFTQLFNSTLNVCQIFDIYKSLSLILNADIYIYINVRFLHFAQTFLINNLKMSHTN